MTDLSNQTEEPAVLDFSVGETGDTSGWNWSLFVNAMEFVREDPLESDLRAAIDQALRSVGGVTDVTEEDREVWLIAGTPDGQQLFGAVQEVIETFAPRIREVIYSD